MELTYRIGFTGTREGMTLVQKEFISHALLALCTEPHRNVNDYTFWFHHGDCIGADSEACEMARNMGYKIWRHPPLEKIYNRALQPFDATDPSYSYHGRNHRIAIRAQTMLAAPLKSSGGGTWNAINWARTLLKPLLIVHPDGSWIEERVTSVGVLKYLEEKHVGRIGKDK